MKFYRKEYRSEEPLSIKYPCFVLIPNTWNDAGYRTLFKLWLYRTSETRIQIGDVKIADLKHSVPDKAEVITVIRERFLKLPKHQASLGQSVEYYENLKEMFPSDYARILFQLNDLTTNYKLLETFQHLDVFKKSLIRSSEAEKIVSQAFTNEQSEVHEERAGFNFTYAVRLPGADDAHTVEFSFAQKSNDQFHTVVLVGKNGTGKTQYLAHFANSLCDSAAEGNFIPSRPLFSKVISVSFSLFDKFKIPRSSKQFSYKYIGFRQSDKILPDSVRDSRLRMAFNEVKKKRRTKEWFQFIGEVIDLAHINSITGKNSYAESTLIAKKDFDVVLKNRAQLLSSGQSILIFIVTELLANIQRDSIILYDEPETHLHPNAIAKLIKALNNILQRYNSFAIIATHSPIVIQETPSRNVRLFDRIGNRPIIKPLPDESFGENLSKITDSIFYLNQVKEGYKEYFDEQIQHKTIEKINRDFNNKLSMNALLYLNAVSSKRKTRKK